MRYNEKAKDYPRYIESINREQQVQNRLYKQIQSINNKIKSIDKESHDQNRAQKLVEWYKEDIKKLNSDIEQSKSRQKFYEQKICNHDFGIISCEYTDENNKTFQSGFCLDCDAEFDDQEGKIFLHSFNMNRVLSSMTFGDYKNLLGELKRIGDYDSEYDFLVGEKIIEDMVKRANNEKKK